MTDFDRMIGIIGIILLINGIVAGPIVADVDTGDLHYYTSMVTTAFGIALTYYAWRMRP